MASRRTTQSQPVAPSHTPEQIRKCIIRLKKCIDSVRAFDPSEIRKPHGDPLVLSLESAIEAALEVSFGLKTSAYRRYEDASNLYGHSSVVIGGGWGEQPTERERLIKAQAKYLEGKERTIALLEAAISELESELDFASLSTPAPTDENKNSNKNKSRKVFIVHGHDEATKISVAEFLRKIEFIPIILHEQPNKGRTIIEKFQQEASDVGFAVVLMTPDDVGSKQGGDLKPRARQNVVMELGFFLGALGPGNVAAMLKGNIERPSDYDGVLYISLEAADWKTELATELEAAGYEVDWNKAMKKPNSYKKNP